MATTTNDGSDYLQLVSDSGKQFVSTARTVQGLALDAAGVLADQASFIYNQTPGIADPARAINLAFDLTTDLIELQQSMLLRLAELLPRLEFAGATTAAPATTSKMVTAAA
jgi:hypothetical protein